MQYLVLVALIEVAILLQAMAGVSFLYAPSNSFIFFWFIQLFVVHNQLFQ